MDELIENDLRSARRALKDLVGRRTELCQAAERAVVEWRWARKNSDLQRPEPLYRERFGAPAPRLLDSGPAAARDEQQYGYDAEGNIIVAREYVGPGSFREEIRIPGGETVTGYRWSETGAPLEVNVARYAGGKIRSYVTVWPEAREDSLQEHR